MFQLDVVFCVCLQDDLTGQAILDLCFARLNLIETAYFGLRYLDDENQTVSCIDTFVLTTYNAAHGPNK